MANNCQTGDSGASSDDSVTPSALHAAVQLGDLVRQQTNRQLVTNGGVPSFWSTPGLVDALVAGTAVAVLLTPVRGRILRAAAPLSLGLLPDLVVTSTQAVAAALSALYVGSLQGSRFYLKQIAHTSNSQSSPEARVAEAVCRSDLVTRWLTTASEDPATRAELRDPSQRYFSQDPRRQTLEAFAAALEACHRRRGLFPEP